MKKFILLLAALAISFSFTSLKNQNVEEVLVSGKWFVDSIQEKGQEPEKAEDKNDEWLLFYADGKLEENQFGELLTCKWKFEKQEGLIKKLEGDAVEYLKVIEITSDKLIVEQFELNGSDEGVMITYVK